MSELADRMDVAEACTRMGWHADRREWDLLAEVFDDEVALDYTSLQGGEPQRLAREAVISAWRGLFERLQATQHLVANHLVSVDGDTATCTAAFQAAHFGAAAFGSPLWMLGGHYRFGLVRRDGRWRIGSVVMTADWAWGNRDVLNAAAAADA